MSSAAADRIHPSAVISSEAELASDVVVGPYAVIEGQVRIDAGCVIRPYVHLCGPLTLGQRNQVFSGSVIGERPQHLRYNDEPTRVEIGDDNIIREHVTIHRGTTQSWTTQIGSNNLLMAHCHVAHDCRIGNHCILTNGCLVGGHCVLEDNVYLSGNSAVHQFMRVGRLALLSGVSATTKDVPPFVIVQGFNIISGVNVVGMRRAGIDQDEINAVRRAFHILYLRGHLVTVALTLIEQELGSSAAVAELVAFIRNSTHGITSRCERRRGAAA